MENDLKYNMKVINEFVKTIIDDDLNMLNHLVRSPFKITWEDSLLVIFFRSLSECKIVREKEGRCASTWKECFEIINAILRKKESKLVLDDFFYFSQKYILRYMEEEGLPYYIRGNTFDRSIEHHFVIDMQHSMPRLISLTDYFKKYSKNGEIEESITDRLFELPKCFSVGSFIRDDLLDMLIPLLQTQIDSEKN